MNGRYVPRIRRVVRGTARRFRRFFDTPPTGDVAATEAPTPSPPTELGPHGSRRQLSYPERWSEASTRSMLGSLSIDGAPAEELAAYLAEDYERFMLTWELLQGRSGRALEIGANPYFTTLLLLECSDLDLTLTNCFDPAATGVHEQTVVYEHPISGTERRRTLEYESLDVERSTFPWGDSSFDVVVFAEVIEHLTIDPVAALAEINRVLKPGGELVITTPNVARLENVARLAAGANMYDPYSGYGPFGRHNREYTRHELVRLLEFCGFGLDTHFTADVHPHRTSSFVAPELLAPLVSNRVNDLGQYLFARAVKLRDPRPGRPSELYRSLSSGQLHTWD